MYTLRKYNIILITVIIIITIIILITIITIYLHIPSVHSHVWVDSHWNDGEGSGTCPNFKRDFRSVNYGPTYKLVYKII